MAKKKKTSKKQEKKEFSYSPELIGILLIIIGLIGLGKFGIVGTIVKKFAMFLLGEWWFTILLLLLFLGFCMIVKRKLPNFFDSKLIGVYIIILVVLVTAHFGFINNYEPNDIINATISNYQSRIGTMSEEASFLSSGQKSISIGGGIFGAGCSFVLANLFGKVGSIIVLAALVLLAVVMLFDVNLGEIFVNFKNDLEERRALRAARREEEEDEEEEPQPKKKSTSTPKKKSTKTTSSKKTKSTK